MLTCIPNTHSLHRHRWQRQASSCCGGVLLHLEQVFLHPSLALDHTCREWSRCRTLCQCSPSFWHMQPHRCTSAHRWGSKGSVSSSTARGAGRRELEKLVAQQIAFSFLPPSPVDSARLTWQMSPPKSCWGKPNKTTHGGPSCIQDTCGHTWACLHRALMYCHGRRREKQKRSIHTVQPRLFSEWQCISTDTITDRSTAAALVCRM